METHLTDLQQSYQLLQQCYLSHVRIDQPKQVWRVCTSLDQPGHALIHLFFMIHEVGEEKGREIRSFIDILIITQMKETFLLVNYVDAL